MQELFRIETFSAEETVNLSQRLAALCASGDCIALRGDLGAGKTTFARAFIQAIAGNIEVTSPTFTLVQTYPSVRGTLWHFDLYRIEHEQELTEVGLDEALESGICLIEWPEIAESALPSTRLNIQIRSGSNENTRLVIASGNATWHTRLKDWQNL